MFAIFYLVCGLAMAASGNAQVTLGSAAPFGIVAATTITNTGLTVVTGELGLYPGTSITGFPPGISGTVHDDDAVAQAAQADATTAFNTAAALPSTEDLTGQDLGGLVLTPGVYTFSSSAQLTGTLTLDGRNNPNGQFVFQIGSTLTTATAASVVLINQASACNVFFQVGSSATLGTATQFVGNILASASVTVNSAVSVQGGLYALTAAVTLIDDTITAQTTCGTAVTSSAAATATTCPAAVTSTVTADPPIAATVTVQITTTVVAPASSCPVASASSCPTNTVFATSTWVSTVTRYSTSSPSSTKTSSAAWQTSTTLKTSSSTWKASSTPSSTWKASSTLKTSSTPKPSSTWKSSTSSAKATSTKKPWRMAM